MTITRGIPMPVGRPTKYKPEYCEMLIEHMASGLSYDTFPAVANCSLAVLYDWEKRHPEFLEAKKEAFNRNRLFWEKVGIEGMFMGGKDNPFNATVWIFNMKNRFSWRDKVEHDSSEEGIKVTLSYEKDS